MHTLLSDWMEHDVGYSLGDDEEVDDESADTSTDDTPTTRYNVDPMNTTSPLTAPRRTKQGKKKKYRLQWRPPGMDKKSSSRRTRSASPTITRGVASSQQQSTKNNSMGGRTNPSKSSMPRLPPSSSTSRKKLIHTPTGRKNKKNRNTSSTIHDNNDDDDQSISTFRSFTTFRSSASSIFTTKSTATQKHSNKATTKKYIPSQSVLLESLEYDYSPYAKSTNVVPSPPTTKKKLTDNDKDKSSGSLPPLSRYTRRRRRRTALLNSSLDNKKYEQEQSTTTTTSQPSIKQAMSSQSSTDIAYAKTMAVLDNDKYDKDLNKSVESYESSNKSQHNVTFENMKIKVTNNYDASSSPCTESTTTGATTTAASNTDSSENNRAILQISSPLDINNIMCGTAPDLDEARYLIDNTCLNKGYTATSLLMNDVHENITSGKTCSTDLLVGSPTSVGRFPNNVQCAGPLDEYMTKLSFGKTNTNDCDKSSSVWNNIISTTNNDYENNDDQETVATLDSNDRRLGPIDIDTCTRHLTSTERRHLHAMHTLGHTHIRNAQYPQAIEVFTEILRGQKERHGKRSLQTAVAMHNLGVVCMKCKRYVETVRLCDGAARIRVEHLGRDHVDVASSLSQQGVALMELNEFELALASFREALRIRTKASWGVVVMNDNNATANTTTSYHPLIIRLLNNIGCALFELNELMEARVTFENALRMQRELMKGKNNHHSGNKLGSDKVDGTFDIDPRDAYHTPLSIALTLTNLGSIHVRLKEYDKSLVYFEEAVLVSSCTMSFFFFGRLFHMLTLALLHLSSIYMFLVLFFLDSGICFGREP